MGRFTLGLLMGHLLNATISVFFCLLSIFLMKRNRAQLVYRRIYLGRVLVMTLTTENRLVFALTHVMDAINFVLLVAALSKVSTVY